MFYKYLVSLVLYSGGLDSTALVHYLASKGEDFDCLFVDYGQRSARQQLSYARENCERLGRRLIEARLSDIRRVFTEGMSVSPHEPVKHRNVILLTLALVLAAERGYKRVYWGTVKEDCVYEPNRERILEKLGELADLLSVEIIAPFRGMPKSFVLRLGVKHGMDPLKTYSCLLGHKAHCGVCSQCEARKRAFAEAGIQDPTEYMR